MFQLRFVCSPRRMPIQPGVDTPTTSGVKNAGPTSGFVDLERLVGALDLQQQVERVHGLDSSQQMPHRRVNILVVVGPLHPVVHLHTGRTFGMSFLWPVHSRAFQISSRLNDLMIRVILKCGANLDATDV